jgi:hypothetical protein
MIKKSIMIGSIILIAVLVISIVIKYQVEGETNMPFKISKIMAISSAQGIKKETSDNRWDFDIFQTNDIYIDITKNKNYNKTEIIDKIIIDNFVIDMQQAKGNIKQYKPTYKEKEIYLNSEENIIQEQLIYIGSEKTNLKNLEIANQGGLILIGSGNDQIGKYTSNEETEVRHDGTLVKKIGLKNEDIKYKLSFDITIILKEDKQYKSTITLELPIGDITEEGISSYEKTDLSNLIFKRQ